MYLRSSFALLTLIVLAALGAAPAFGSAIIGRDVSRPTLSIDRQGRAHVGYVSGGRRTVLVASGAINARSPSRSLPQVEFRIRYGEGGSGVCLPYDGPPLAWLVEACKAPDGSYWAYGRYGHLGIRAARGRGTARPSRAPE